MKEKTKKVSEPGSFKLWKVPAWASRAAALTVNIAVLLQVTYYCTDALGMAPGLVGMLLLVSKLFDGFTDLAAGFIIDKTHSKWGKARPYEFCILLAWIFTVFMFSTPASFSTTGKCIWVFITYTMICSVFQTFLNASDAVYMARAFTSQDTQTKILSFASPIQMICSIAAGATLPIMINSFGSEPGGWTKIGLIFAVPYGILGLARFFFIKELDIEETQQESSQQSLKSLLNIIRQNKYIFIISIFTLVGGLIQNIGSAVTNYYFQYIYGDLNVAGLFGALSIISPFLLVIMPILLKKNSLAKLTMVSCVIGALGNLLKFVGKTNLPILIVGNLLTMVPLMFSCMINIFLIECMDFGEWKNGVRVEGGLGSINGFASKLGTGLSSVIVGFVMQLAGYDGTLAQQSQSANFAIIALYSLIPLALFIVQFIVMKQYDLDKKLPQIRAELGERNNA
ncbi:MAG: hypothetical protein HDR30_00040 [Lachnospiraceae bacterium]|nr:hypothetical protein [Lachnospiraceae bacterium]